MAKSPEEKLIELEAAKVRIQNRIKKERSAIQKRKRKDDARRKIIVGAVVLAHADHDEQFGELLWSILKTRTLRDADREFLGLPPLPDQASN